MLEFDNLSPLPFNIVNNELLKQFKTKRGFTMGNQEFTTIYGAEYSNAEK